MIKSLDVMLWGRKVGTLVAGREKYRDRICFYFDREYVRNGYDIAPLQASINGVTAQKGLPVYPEEDKLFGGLPSFIADSLPDHWGNTVFNEWVKTHGVRIRDLTALDRLTYIGRRGMGALEFLPPAAEELETPFKVEVTELYELARRMYEQAKDFKAVMSGDLMMESLFRVGTSAGGKRPKAVINVNYETGQCYSGQVGTPYPGYTPAIIKFDEHGTLPTTRIEYSYYLMALDAGLTMMPSRLLEGEQNAHFITERFDRKGDGKIHVQTLAALNPVSKSYEELIDTACKIGVPPAEVAQLFRLMVMNVLCGNVDDHTKNFSFTMQPDGHWHIAPAYDFTFSIDPAAPPYVNRHSMTINNKNEYISRADLLTVAERFGIKSARSCIDKVADTVRNYPEYAVKAGVDSRWIDVIHTEILSRIKNLDE